MSMICLRAIALYSSDVECTSSRDHSPAIAKVLVFSSSFLYAMAPRIVSLTDYANPAASSQPVATRSNDERFWNSDLDLPPYYLAPEILAVLVNFSPASLAFARALNVKVATLLACDVVVQAVAKCPYLEAINFFFSRMRIFGDFVDDGDFGHMLKRITAVTNHRQQQQEVEEEIPQQPKKQQHYNTLRCLESFSVLADFDTLYDMVQSDFQMQEKQEEHGLLVFLQEHGSKLRSVRIRRFHAGEHEKFMDFVGNNCPNLRLLSLDGDPESSVDKPGGNTAGFQQSKLPLAAHARERLLDPMKVRRYFSTSASPALQPFLQHLDFGCSLRVQEEIWKAVPIERLVSLRSAWRPVSGGDRVAAVPRNQLRQRCCELTDDVIDEAVARLEQTAAAAASSSSSSSSSQQRTGTRISSSNSSRVFVMQRISLRSCPWLTGAGFCKLLHHSPFLSSVTLHSCAAVCDETLQCLAAFCPHLAELELSKPLPASQRRIAPLANEVTQDALMAIVSGACPNLRALTVGRCIDVTDELFAAIAQHCRQLRKLALSVAGENSSVTDKSLELLCGGHTSASSHVVSANSSNYFYCGTDELLLRKKDVCCGGAHSSTSSAGSKKMPQFVSLRLDWQRNASGTSESPLLSISDAAVVRFAQCFAESLEKLFIATPLLTRDGVAPVALCPFKQLKGLELWMDDDNEMFLLLNIPEKKKK